MTEELPVGNRRFPWGRYWLALVLILIFTLFPVFSVIFASTVANANGCQLDEGNIHPCIVFGSDWGHALYGFGVMGWLGIATLPFGGGALIVWLVILVIHRLAWRHGRRKELSQ